MAAAHRLTELSRERKLDLQIALLEARQRVGGCIATERIGDFLVEAGPDSFISEKPWALRLCDRLGLSSRLISTNTSRQNIFVVHGTRLVPLPEGFLLMAPTRLWPLIRTPLFSWRGKLRMALELFLPRGSAEDDESLAAFVRRRFGREVLERVAQPLIGGIYAGDPEKLSLAATMPRFLEMERTRRSVIWAMLQEQRRRRAKGSSSGAGWSLFLTLAGGMQELVESIASRLPVGAVRLRAKALGLAWDSAKRTWTVATNEERFEADGVILAAPADAAAELLAPLAPKLSDELNEIPYCSTATVTLAYREDEVPRNLNGFGFVAPTVESRKIMACTFSSVKYPGRAAQGFVLLRAFVGGALQPLLCEQDDRALESSVRQELKDLLGIGAEPIICRIHRHPRSMPQYHVGHLERVQRIEDHLKKLPGLALAGNAYHGVGIADCVHSGEKASENLLHAVERVEAL